MKFNLFGIVIKIYKTGFGFRGLLQFFLDVQSFFREKLVFIVYFRVYCIQDFKGKFSIVVCFFFFYFVIKQVVLFLYKFYQRTILRVSRLRLNSFNIIYLKFYLICLLVSRCFQEVFGFQEGLQEIFGEIVEIFREIRDFC